MARMNGPDPENLRRLHENLPDFVEQRESKRIFAGQKPVSKSRAHKACRICGKLFDFRIIENMLLPELGECDKCSKLLKQGYIAFSSANYYCFGKSKSLEDLAGTVVECSPEIMQKLQDVFSLEWETKSEVNGDEIK